MSFVRSPLTQNYAINGSLYRLFLKKDLGVLLTINLKYRSNILLISCKVIKMLWFLKRISSEFRHCSRKAQYRFLVRLILKYEWFHILIVDTILEKVQRHFISFSGLL